MLIWALSTLTHRLEGASANRLAAPGCAKVGSQWDRCGVHYVEPAEGPQVPTHRR